MPSSATITSFYNFSANTKARASQVNNNFDVFRGHIIPVEPLTATSSDNTYDLGDFSHRWRYGYFGQTRYGTTSTAYGSVQLASDTTSAELIFNLNGVEKARINSNGIVANSGRTFGQTSSAGIGQMAVSSIITESLFYETTTYTSIPGTTLTIQSTGRSINIKAIHGLNNTITTFGFGNIGGGNNIFFQLVRQNDNSKIVYYCSTDRISNPAPITMLNFKDNPSSGTWTYYLQYKYLSLVHVSNYLNFMNTRLAAIEE